MKAVQLKGAVLLLLFIFFFNNYTCQNYFSKRLNIAGKVNLANCLKVYNDSIYIPTLVTESTGPLKYSCSLVKTDFFGIISNSQRFRPNNIISYSGGNDLHIKNNKFYIASVTDYGLQLQAGLYVFKQNGDTLYTKSYGDTMYYNYGNKILPYLKDKGKLLLIGSTDSTCGSNHPGLFKPIIRVVDTNGVLYQTKLFNASCIYLSLWDADTTIKKSIVFCGGAYNGSFTKNYIIKLDSNLNQQWNKNIDTGTSLSCAITSIKNGNLIFAHNHSDYSSSIYLGEKITLTKLDQNGNILWRKRYGSPEDIYVSRIRECSNGDFILCGEKTYSYTTAANQLMGWLMRTDSLGNLKWWYRYIPNDPVKDTIAQCYLYDVLQMPDGGFAAVGSVGGSNTFATIQQTWLLRVDSNGCFGPGNCPQNLLSGIHEQNQSLASLVTIYPNPANSKLNIELSILNNKNYNLQITNALGQTVHQTIENNQKSVVNISEFPQGIYFVTIKTGSAVLTKKVAIEH